MSINYYGIATADRERIGLLVEGNPQPDVPPLDIDALHQALTSRTRLVGPTNGTLRWEDSEGGYVFVDLSPTCVLVTQGTGGGDDVIDVIIELIDTLHRAGVNVYDPQQGGWFPGSPVTPRAETETKVTAKAATKGKAKPAPTKAKPKAKTKAKVKPAPKAKAKAKPKAKAKAKPKAKAKAKPKAKTKPKAKPARR